MTDPHRRFNPLTQEWVLVSPQRLQRPWKGEVAAPASLPPAHDPACYLCPGNPRAAGRTNPNYNGVYIFENDFPTVRDEAPSEAAPTGSPLLRREPERGLCRVLCFSPRHDLSLARLPLASVEAVVAAWVEQSSELMARPEFASVMVFENRGAMMGASSPHPHGQIWANSHLPDQLERERQAFVRRCLLCDYLALELSRAGGLDDRLICANEHFALVVPYWAYWPFEALLISRRHCATLPDLAGEEAAALADILRRLMIRYDNLFETPFPLGWGFHQHGHLHAHFYPPLLRSATVRKFMVGYELLAMPQRDLTAEQAAARMREQSEQHYLDKSPRGGNYGMGSA
ncbi:MAG TPA: galactose-1-phosphate uridylyltransferase [Terriglobales bacterium]|nr:galactose-1-phosphate uridylyltransferase [Terriglobales bacterium]